MTPLAPRSLRPHSRAGSGHLVRVKAYVSVRVSVRVSVSVRVRVRVKVTVGVGVRDVVWVRVRVTPMG